MKTLVIVLAVVFVAVVAWLLVSSGGRTAWQPKTTITFIGFTNTVPQAPATNAWFGL